MEQVEYSYINKGGIMKTKLWLKYLIYIVLISFLIFVRSYVGNLFTAYFKREFQYNYFYVVITTLLGVCIGVLLGIEHFIKERRNEGTWNINMPKLILVGLPSLYLSLTNILIYSKIDFFHTLAYPLLYLLKLGSSYVILFQLILGFVVITSFNKSDMKV